MLAMHLSLKFWGVCFNLKTKTQHGIVFDGGGYKNSVLFSLAFVSQVSAVVQWERRLGSYVYCLG